MQQIVVLFGSTAPNRVDAATPISGTGGPSNTRLTRVKIGGGTVSRRESTSVEVRNAFYARMRSMTMRGRRRCEGMTREDARERFHLTDRKKPMGQWPD